MNLNDLLLDLPIVIRNRFAANNFAQWIKMCNRAIAEINHTCAGPGRMITISPRGNDQNVIHVPKQIETVNAVFIDGVEVDFTVKNRVIICENKFPSISQFGTAVVNQTSPIDLFVQSSSIPFLPEAGVSIEFPGEIYATVMLAYYTTGPTLSGIVLVNQIPDAESSPTVTVFKPSVIISGYERTLPISSVSETIIIPDGYDAMLGAYLRYYAELQDDEGSRTADKWLNEAIRIKDQFMSIQTKAEGKSAPFRSGFRFRRAK